MMGGHGMFHGTTRGLVDEEVFGKVYDQRVIRRLIPYIKPYKHLTALATVAMFIYVGTQVAIPWIIKTGIDGYIGVDGGGDFGGLALVFALFMGSALLNWASNYTMQMAMTRAGQGVLYDIRSLMFRHLQKLSLRFFDNTEVGRTMSRVQGDVWQLQEFMSLAVMTLGDLLSLAGIVVALLIMNLKLGLITMVVLPLLIAIMAVWQGYARRAFMRVRRAISIVNGALNENITGVRVVQSMNRQQRNLELFDEKNQENLDSNLVASRLSSGLMLPVDMLTGVAIGLAIFFGARMVTGDELGVGALMLICFSFPSRNPAKAVALGLASNILPMISAFSDTMSYIRLMAVGLASYYIALAFNNLAMDVGSGGVALWIPAGLILLFAHTLNIILGLIAVFAHGVRLNMLEFSSNAGVQWAGYPYAPFAKTRTVDAGEY